MNAIKSIPFEKDTIVVEDMGKLGFKASIEYHDGHPRAFVTSGSDLDTVIRRAESVAAKLRSHGLL